MPRALPAYLEVGAKRVFAGAIDWPGWCRSGRDEDAALEALADYAPRYRRALRGSRLGFPSSASVPLRVVERLRGGPTTDFGAPGEAPSADAAPVDDAELRRLLTLLRACWRTFDGAVERAEGRPLSTGPRGGGRALDRIVAHVTGADAGYLGALGWKVPGGDAADADRIRSAIADGLKASVRGAIPGRGPRGGTRWTARYFVRRSAWHVLDHAWEVEDRVDDAAGP